MGTLSILGSNRLKGIKASYIFNNRYFSTFTIGIRKEAKNRWESRAPLIPAHVSQLIKETKAKVIVQPCTKRVFPNESYIKAGATVNGDLSKADVILGVKEVPIQLLLEDKTYMFFSHTHKGQSYNMPMLDQIMQKKITLIDYELMKDSQNKRTVMFGVFAGYAGMINALHGLGDRLLTMGYSTPLLNMGLAHQFPTLEHAKKTISEIGDQIKKNAIPKALGPLIFVFTGSGNVSTGAKQIFELLPHQWIKPRELKQLVESKAYNQNIIYGCCVKAEDYLEHVHGNEFNRTEYLENPQLYKSIFHKKIAPYSSVIINGIYWEAKYPRLLTIQQYKDLKDCRLISLADISCDIKGPFEFMDRASTIDEPFFYYDRDSSTYSTKSSSSGLQIMSIDNLPTQLPKEASLYFGNALYPLIKDLAIGNRRNPVLMGATITRNGQLVDSHKHLQNRMNKVLKSETKKKILVLGSGYVSGPLIDYLHRNEKYEIILSSNSQEEANKIANNRPRIVVKNLNVEDRHDLLNQVSQADVVVSLIPASLHIHVAEACLEARKHLVTASYVSQPIADLHEKAVNADIVIFKEVGLDPGIDHLTAMKNIHDIQDQGGEIKSFISWCGGLPAPECSDNPLGYKFSWSPKSVLLASMNSAKYKLNGKVYEVPGTDLLRSSKNIKIYPGFNFEGYPNRDSLKYEKIYGIETADTVFRGTLRYHGFSNIMSGLIDLGLLQSIPVQGGSEWKNVLMMLLKCNKANLANLGEFISKLSPHKNTEAQRAIVDAINWLELNSEYVIKEDTTVIDALCDIMKTKMSYKTGERDMVCLHHIFEFKLKNALVKRTSTLVSYGTPNGYSAMAKTVGTPAAIAVDMILKNKVSRRGVIIPTTPDLYQPILDELKNEGISIVEKDI
ncbi:Alanine dehydrogenase/PNT, NAD(H)-binding domain-containing protein [Rozella allomycis CSF55]|uniref:Alanine dehydrogenase/PNT, NAD(H)-binding domain-containing protein n=1 Tax=Rozella allomycis (strain CSF55) TaxID=988480 RepID=A0A075AR70_ROZAC|nr:Alanine dehydrogenase/PNT, NAD(H)-binding domain-containing protein [Rozella allomycis CSF55]|eukprot:EPZ32733.1 Alanine dehydrogenase/PNT, NAD(H)-binding domain-containing protein [Rozella allomycis CSF55]